MLFYRTGKGQRRDAPHWRALWEWLFNLSRICASTAGPLTRCYVRIFLTFIGISGPYPFPLNAKKLKGFTKLLKTTYLRTYKYDHQLKDTIAAFEKPPWTRTDKTTPDIHPSSGKVSDGEDDWTLSTSSDPSFVTLGGSYGWDLGFVSFHHSDFILWHCEMEPRYRCCLVFQNVMTKNQSKTPGQTQRLLWEPLL